MAGRAVVGLDIGTSGVRAAELTHGKGPTTLTRFGQVALPPGAVRDGEVVDIDEVAAAIRQLWASTKFGTKRVVVGVSNQKVVARQVDLPRLAAEELHSARWAIETSAAAFVEEVRGSLDYYRHQPRSVEVQRIVLSGGGGQLRGLAERLALANRMPVERGTAMTRLKVGKVGLTAEQLSFVAPLVSVPVGLAMGVAS